VAFYQVAKSGFFLYVFLQCWDMRGTRIPPFGDVQNHFFKAPDFFLYPLLGAVHFVLAIGLVCLGQWARVCLTLLFLATLGVWLLSQMSGQESLLFPLESATMLSAFAADAIGVGVLYVAQSAREAFAPMKAKPPL
jgi:hypothetical protein